MTNKPIIICNVILRAWFVRLEQTKALVFVFVLAHEQAIRGLISKPAISRSHVVRLLSEIQVLALLFFHTAFKIMIFLLEKDTSPLQSRNLPKSK